MLVSHLRNARTTFLELPSPEGKCREFDEILCSSGSFDCSLQVSYYFCLSIVFLDHAFPTPPAVYFSSLAWLLNYGPNLIPQGTITNHARRHEKDWQRRRAFKKIFSKQRFGQCDAEPTFIPTKVWRSRSVACILHFLWCGTVEKKHVPAYLFFKTWTVSDFLFAEWHCKMMHFWSNCQNLNYMLENAQLSFVNVHRPNRRRWEVKAFSKPSPAEFCSFKEMIFFGKHLLLSPRLCEMSSSWKALPILHQ